MNDNGPTALQFLLLCIFSAINSVAIVILALGR